MTINASQRAGVIGESVGRFIAPDFGVSRTPVQGDFKIRVGIEGGEDIGDEDEGHCLAGVRTRV